jgi:transposase
MKLQSHSAHANPDYLNLPGIHTLAEPECHDLCIRVQAEQIWLQKCPICGCDSRDVRPNGTREQIVLDEPRGLKSVKIILKRRSYKCWACGKKGLLPLDCLVERRGMTRRLLDFIEKESLLRPFREVALEVDLSPRTVSEIFKVRKGVAEAERSATFTSPRVLGIDGVYIKRKERAILTNIENKEIIDIWDSVNAGPLTEALKNLPNSDKIEVVVMDMSTPLKKAVKAALPHAAIVIDRYHIERMGNQALDKVRQRLRPKRRRKNQPTMCKSSLLRKHWRQLEGADKVEVKRWFSIKPDLKTAYNLKERFFSIWHTKRKATAQENYRQWLLSVPPELSKDFRELITAMNNWSEYIFNFFDHEYTNAFTESSNRRIKDIQREARRGKFDTVRAKAIYGTIVRQQLRAARERQAKPTWVRAKKAGGEVIEKPLIWQPPISIQMPLFNDYSM